MRIDLAFFGLLFAILSLISLYLLSQKVINAQQAINSITEKSDSMINDLSSLIDNQEITLDTLGQISRKNAKYSEQARQYSQSLKSSLGLVAEKTKELELISKIDQITQLNQNPNYLRLKYIIKLWKEVISYPDIYSVVDINNIEEYNFFPKRMQSYLDTTISQLEWEIFRTDRAFERSIIDQEIDKIGFVRKRLESLVRYATTVNS